MKPIRMTIIVVSLLLMISPAVAEDLFTSAQRPLRSVGAGEVEVLRERHVSVDISLIETSGIQPIEVNLFDDTKLMAILETIEATPGDGFVWKGSVPGRPNSLVLFSVQNGIVIGNITLPPDEFYQIRYVTDGVHVIRQIDPGSFPEEAEPEEVVIPPDRLEEAKWWPMRDDGSLVDILVVYTQDARTAEGGTSAIEALIHLAVYETNLSYQNSDIDQRLNLVHLEEVVYTESGDLCTDRARLKEPSDGHMDNVHTLRNTYCADVSILICDNGGGYCGCAYIMSTVSNAFEEYAFCAVANECATGYYSFGHELGHIMSARHDWYVDDTNNSPYTYNHGFVNVTDSWRTVMAYNRHCTDSAGTCTRLPYWSNPNVTYGGDDMGVPEGTSTSCSVGDLSNPDCDAENWKTLDNTAYTVANFRQYCTGTNDCWMKDTWSDTGAEPDPLTASESMWKSPYIWARHISDPDRLHQHEHQNPEFGQDNYVYAEIHNGGSTMNGDLELYWAHAATGLAWPGDWHLIDAIPLNIQNEATEVVEFVWSSLPGTGHYCLLARWDSAADPMTYPEGTSVENNTRNNNNIIWKNVNILDDFADDGMDMATFFVRQVTDGTPWIDLLTQLAPMEEFLNTGGEMWLALDPVLFDRWVANGAQGYGFEIVGQDSVQIFANEAMLQAIPLDWMEEGQINVTFVSDNPDQVGVFNVEFVQIVAQEQVGGVVYKLHVRDEPMPSLHGRVANTADEPLPDIEVSLFREEWSDWILVDSAITDPWGAYGFIAPPDTYRVCYDDPTGIYSSQCFYDATDVESAIDVVLVDVPVPHIDVELDIANPVPDGVQAPVSMRFNRINPNPFTVSTTFFYELPREATVRLAIYDLAGRKVRTLFSEHQTPGYKVVTWDGRNDDGNRVASGTYLVKLEAAGRVLTKKVILLN